MSDRALRRDERRIRIDAELRVPAAAVHLLRIDLPEPAQDILYDDQAYRFGLCLRLRSSGVRARYRERWNPHRLERLGAAFVVPPGEPLEIHSAAGSHASLLCQIAPEAIRTWFDGKLRWTQPRLEATLDLASPNIRSLLLRLAGELRHPGFASEVLVELIAAQLAIELSRHCGSITERWVAGGLAPWRLRLIDERLREVREAPTLAELADLCGISVRQLTRGFRASRGCSIGEHVERIRLDHAERLLTTDQSIKAIAYSLGFSSPSAFAYAFRRATGETPRQFRQRLAMSRWSEAPRA